MKSNLGVSKIKKKMPMLLLGVVLLVSLVLKLNNLLMFLTSHTARPYFLKTAWKSLSQQVQVHGGTPYIVTFRELNLPILFKSYADKRTIYLVKPRD